jgi:hypothetical protein
MPPIVAPHFISAERLQRSIEKLHDRPVERRRNGPETPRSSNDAPPVVKRSEETIHDIVARLSTAEVQRRECHRAKLEATYLKSVSKTSSSSPKSLVDRLYVAGREREAATNKRLVELYTPRRATLRLPKSDLDNLSQKLSTPRAIG